MSERVCDVCGRPTAGNGFAAVNWHYGKSSRRFSWMFGHVCCLPWDANYWISEYGLRTPHLLGARLRLLAEHRWFRKTDFFALMQRLGFVGNEAKGGNVS